MKKFISMLVMGMVLFQLITYFNPSTNQYETHFYSGAPSTILIDPNGSL